MKDHVRILLVGDDGVGKSSLISTFIARHFPSSVPTTIADATVPAESTADDVDVTIVDSSAREVERDNLRKKIAAADAVMALYDVTRPETLESISQVWIPLIIEVSNSTKKPILVIGTKIDIVDDYDDYEELAKIFKQFPFIIFASKCSAAKLDVDRVFNVATSLVMHPFFPIFDVATFDFTPAARSAFMRIFRIVDMDNDNAWSDDELHYLQSKCFLAPITAREVPSIKRQIQNMTIGGIANKKVTFEGFLALLRICVWPGVVVVPWTILRHYGYDDDFVLQVPKAVSTPPSLSSSEVSELSDGARSFLLALARNAYAENEKPIAADSESEVEECLTWEALRSIWSVLTVEEPTPWSHPPQCKMVWPENDDKVNPVAQSVLLSSLQHPGGSISFDAWLAQWQALALSDPVRTQVLLFKLGYVDRPDLGLVRSRGTVSTVRDEYKALHAPRSLMSYLTAPFFSSSTAPSSFRPRRTAKVCILGDNGVGKSSLVWYASDLTPPGATDMLGVEKGQTSEKAFESIVVGGIVTKTEGMEETSASPGHGQPSSSVTTEQLAGHLTNPLCVVLVSVPMDPVYKYIKLSIQSCDCVLLSFQCGDENSLRTAMKLEQFLPDHLPRFYVAMKADLLHGHGHKHVNLDLLERHERALLTISLHLKEHDLPPVHSVSTISGIGMSEVLSTVKEILITPDMALPRHYKEKKRRLNLLNQSSLVYLTVAAVGAVSVGLLWKKSTKETVREWLRLDWLHQWLSTSRWIK